MSDTADVAIVERDPGVRVAEQEAIAARAWPSTHAHLFPEGAYAALLAGDGFVTWQVGRSYKSFVALVGGDPVGFATLALVRETDGASRGMVEPIHVLPDWQRHGIGSLLWNRCQDRAMHSDLRSLDVWVLRNNHSAIAFYASRPGIRRTGLQGQLVILDKVQIAIQFRVDFPHR